MAQSQGNQPENIVDDALIELMDALDAIDEHQKGAKLNETSISNGSGGRINL